MQYFPYDRQICSIRFVSWVYTGRELNLVNASKHGDMSSFIDNGVWSVKAIIARRYERKYACCDDLFPELVFYIVMDRQSMYYVHNIIIPAVLITLMSLLVFYLPAESGEKLSLGVTVLLSICVFLIIVMDRMPPTSDTVPLLG